MLSENFLWKCIELHMNYVACSLDNTTLGENSDTKESLSRPPGHSKISRHSNGREPGRWSWESMACVVVGNQDGAVTDARRNSVVRRRVYWSLWMLKWENRNETIELETWRLLLYQEWSSRVGSQKHAKQISGEQECKKFTVRFSMQRRRGAVPGGDVRTRFIHLRY